jgi:hypothetical protein
LHWPRGFNGIGWICGAELPKHGLLERTMQKPMEMENGAGAQPSFFAFAAARLRPTVELRQMNRLELC